MELLALIYRLLGSSAFRRVRSSPTAAEAVSRGTRPSGATERTSHGATDAIVKNDLFDAARGLFDQVGDGLGLDTNSVTPRHLNDSGAGSFRHKLLTG